MRARSFRRRNRHQYKRGPLRLIVRVSYSLLGGYSVAVTNTNGTATPALYNFVTPVPEVSGVGLVMPMTFGAQFDDVQNHTEFTNLYDQYKITGLSFRFTPLRNMSFVAGVSTSGAPAVASLPTFQWALDFDSLNWTGTAALEQKARLKERRFTAPISVYWRPTVEKSIGIGSGGGGTAVAAVSPAGFMDCTADTVTHYGLHAALRNMPDPAIHGEYAFEIKPIYYFTMKEVQ